MAGFIGHGVARKLSLDQDCNVVGIDNLNPYYDPALKQARLDDLTAPNVRFQRLDLVDAAGLDAVFSQGRFDCVVHLAAQAGVRYSLENPEAYGQSNLVGFLNILECCRRYDVRHLVYASSSSVYGVDAPTPFTVEEPADRPASLYAATKKANELMAHSYSHMYGLPTTGLRFFTVYGPWGRPDMALFSFTRNILEGRPVVLYNYGDMTRDFTYVDDIVESIARIMKRIPGEHDSDAVGAASGAANLRRAPCAIYNVGRGQPVSLESFVQAIEQATGRRAIREYAPLQPGDLQHTWADCRSLVAATGYTPQVGVQEGVARFVQWYMRYFNVPAANAPAGALGPATATL